MESTLISHLLETPWEEYGRLAGLKLLKDIYGTDESHTTSKSKYDKDSREIESSAKTDTKENIIDFNNEPSLNIKHNYENIVDDDYSGAKKILIKELNIAVSSVNIILLGKTAFSNMYTLCTIKLNIVVSIATILQL